MGKIQSAVQSTKTDAAPKTMQHWIKAMEPQIAKALPSVITPERFTRMALTAISTNPALAQCTPQSFMGALMNAAQLGLEPNTPLGQAYLIPFKNKGVLETQFQIGYKGLIDLAHRSGEFKTIYAKEVYEKDEFYYEFGLEPKLQHKPYTEEDRGETKFYYAVYTLVNGGFGFEVMSKSDVMAHGKRYSQSYNSSFSPWKSNFDEMAKKTMIKRVLKYAPIKTEFAKQIVEDGTIKTELAADMSEVEDKTVFEGNFEVVEERQETDDPEIAAFADAGEPEFLKDNEEEPDAQA